MEKKTATKPRKIPGTVDVHMKIDDKNEWNFSSNSMCEAIEEGQKICKDNGLKWENVIEWDIS
jgi:hypothetical protein